MAEWPIGGGEMGERMRALDWAATPLGPPAHWPQSLKTAVDTILSGGFPMLALWGPQQLQIYNDPYRALMGPAHPQALGQPLCEGRHEVWRGRQALFASALAGETAVVEDVIHPVDRKGATEQAQFTLSCSPLREESGAVVGVLVTAFETTRRLQLERAQAAQRESEHRYRRLFETMGQGFSAVEFVRDDRGEVSDVRYVEANPALLHLSGIAPEALIGRLGSETLPSDFGWWLPLLRRVAAGESVRVEHYNPDLDRWYDAALHPEGSDRAVCLFDDITERKRAQERQAVLLTELQQRVRNVLGVIRAIVSRSPTEGRTAEGFRAHVVGRIDAMARTQAMLTRGAGAGVDLEELIREELLAQVADEERVTIHGPDVLLSPKAAEILTLAIHELATNAMKYGALSEPAGHVELSWTVAEGEAEERWLHLNWRERGVRVLAVAPRSEGFGTELVTRRAPYELRGRGSIHLRPGGVQCDISFPLRESDSPLRADLPSPGTAG